MLNRFNPAKTLPAMIRFTPAAVIALACALSGGPAHAQMSQSDLITRIDRLEGAIRDLTGQVEQLQYRNQQLSQQVQRLQEATPGGAPAPATPAAEPMPRVAAAAAANTARSAVAARAAGPASRQAPARHPASILAGAAPAA